MDKPQYYTIGEASKICGIAPSTLRYYDKINLVKPALNEDNQYRQYSFKDIAKVKIIQNLRELNFSIEEIGTMLDKGNLSHQLGLMKKKRDELYDEIQELQKTYHAIDNRILNLENEIKILSSHQTSELSIELKHIPKRSVISVRKQSETVDLSSYTLYVNELMEKAKQNQIIPSTNFMLIHHHIDVNEPFNEHVPSLKDVEVCFLAENGIDSTVSRELPEGLHLSLLSKGMAGKERFEEIYHHVHNWLNEHQYRAAGPLMDFVLSDLSNLHPDQVIHNIMTEVQIPIVKIDDTKG